MPASFIVFRLHTGVTYSKYMNLYTAVYNYCTSSRLHGSFENSALGSRSKLFRNTCSYLYLVDTNEPLQRALT